jgi:hypothetical protein
MTDKLSLTAGLNHRYNSEPGAGLKRRATRSSSPASQ